MSHRRVFGICVLWVCLVGTAGCIPELRAPTMPEYPKPSKVTWLEQNWSAEDRFWFHHAAQGTTTFPIPYEWFVALEQPKFLGFEADLLIEPEYLDSFGFISSPRNLAVGDVKDYGYSAPSDKDYQGRTAIFKQFEYEHKHQGDWNPDSLPVGFARSGPFHDPASGQTLTIPGTGKAATIIGLTCAACHTGRMSYRGTELRIDGGQAMTELDEFRTALGLSILWTRYNPFRFGRFADRVLGEDHTGEQADELKEQLKAVFAKAKLGKEHEDAAERTGREPVAEGFYRLDALNRIGNEVFGEMVDDPENLVPVTAPVSFPFIWDAPWIDWAQYNSSIQQPMVRNAGEALGVRAQANLSNPDRPVYQSNVLIPVLVELEELLAGPTSPKEAKQFLGLNSPRWPEEVLGKLDRDLVAKGREVYEKRCAGCHGPPVDSPEFWDDKHWYSVEVRYRDENGEEQTLRSPPYLKARTIPVGKIGTDPYQAQDLAERKVRVPEFLGDNFLGSKPDADRKVAFGPALGQIVENVVTFYYDEQEIVGLERVKLNGYRPNGIRATIPNSAGEQMIQYRTRPLNGVWATAPYLHNGSIPNLRLLLSPQSLRDAEADKFWLGSREFDPVDVGLEYGEIEGGFELDTSLPGNSNEGHEFTDERTRPGRIGPALPEDEVDALLEYLKSI